MGANLKVEITGTPGSEGIVHVGLCDSDEVMKDGDKITKGLQAKLNEDGTAAVTFKNLKPGDYAIKLFLDKNGNHKLDKNRLGIPKEPYGLSNNVRPRFSMPKWKALKFTVGKKGAVQKITLRGK